MLDTSCLPVSSTCSKRLKRALLLSDAISPLAGVLARYNDSCDRPLQCPRESQNDLVWSRTRIGHFDRSSSTHERLSEAPAQQCGLLHERAFL